MSISSKLIQSHRQYNISKCLKQLLQSCKEAIGPAQEKALFEFVNRVIQHHFTESQFFDEAYQIFVEQLDQKKLGSERAALALKRFCEHPEVAAALEQLAEKILPAFHASSDETISIDYSQDTLIINTIDWVEEEFSPVDERTSINDGRKIRRMDSLARLLSLKPSLSACTSVAFDLSEEPMLVISANVSFQGRQDAVMQALALKLEMIQNFLLELSLEKLQFCEKGLEDYALKLIVKLLSQGGSALSIDCLKQAAKKIIDAVCFDDETFTSIEKDLLLTNRSAVLLVPHVDKNGAQIITRTQLADAHFNKTIDLPIVPKNKSVADLHAEQLLSHYLFVELQKKQTLPLEVGCSKLCCAVCFDNLSHHPVLVRGHHGQSYANVVNLLDGQSPTVVSQRRATTHAWRSPKDTPEKREASRRNITFLATQKSRRQLIMDLDEPVSASTSTCHDSVLIVGDEPTPVSSKPYTDKSQPIFFLADTGILDANCTNSIVNGYN